MERMVVAEGKGCCGGREEGGAEEDGEAVKKKRMKGKLRMEKGGEAKGECFLIEPLFFLSAILLGLW